MAAIPVRKSSPPQSSARPVLRHGDRKSSIPPAVRNRASLPPADQLRVEVELNLYSDQPNPRWLLGKSNAETLLAQLPDGSSLTPTAVTGYSGFTIRIDAGNIRRSVQVFHNTELERWLLNSGRFCLPTEVARLVENHLT